MVNADFREILRTDNAMDLLRPVTGPTLDANVVLRFLEQNASKPRPLVMRTTIADASGGAEAVYSFPHILRGIGADTQYYVEEFHVSCAADGTPLAPITQDTSARLLNVET